MTLQQMKQLPASVTLAGVTACLTADSVETLADGVCVQVKNERVGENYQYRTMSLCRTGEGNSGQITAPSIVDAVIPCEGSVMLHTLRGDDCSKNSFLPIDRELHTGDSIRIAPAGGRPSNTTCFPVFDLTMDGYTLLIAIGWDGQWQYTLTRDEAGLHIRITMAYADFHLRPGEKVNLPSALLVLDRDAPSARRSFRRLLTRDFSPLPESWPSDHLPVSIQPFDRYFYGRCPIWPTEEGQLLTLEKAKLCEGFDTQWLDAAWFRDGFPTGVGNYEFEKGYPRGLRPVSDAVREAGMRFMLWFEPERIARGSDIFREHMSFCLSRTDEPEKEDNLLYNLGDETAWQWLFDTLSAFIRENGIDNFRQDYNIDPLDFWLHHDEEGRRGMTEIRYVNGFYRLWDSLRAEFPGLFIDNCSSGGRRIEWETLRRAVPMWRSDITCGPITETAHNDVYNQNETLTLGEYLPYHACAVWEPNANDFRSAATAGIACTFDILNPDFDFAMAKKLLAEEHRLAPHWSGDFYPLTKATLDEDCFAAYQLSGGDKGYAAVFRRAECTGDTMVLRLRAVDADREYRVTLTDEYMRQTTAVVSGKVLMEGYPVTLPQPRSTLIAEYEKK